VKLTLVDPLSMNFTLGVPTTCQVGYTIVLYKRKNINYVLTRMKILFAHAKNGEEHNHEQKILSYPIKEMP